MGNQPKISISPLLQSEWQTQTEMLEVHRRQQSLFIGIPKEVTLQENRVALTPSSVATLVAHGHRVLIETTAGKKSNFSDRDFSEAGAEIAFDKEQVFKANILLKVAPPTLDEIALMHHKQILISPLQLTTIGADYIERLREKRVTALAMEYMKDKDDSFPIVRIMSEIAGISAIQTAAELLTKTQNGVGILLGGISGVAPAKVVILGAGVVAEFATRAALGLGADVRVFDNNIYKLMRLQKQIGRQIYTSSIDAFYLEQELLNADVVIGAIHSKSGRAPMIVQEDMVMKMKPGAVIVDVSIDQGGCFATSEVTTHEQPTFVKHDIVHYCVPNIASRTPRTASMAISNVLTPLLLKTQFTGSIEDLLYGDAGLRHGVYTFKGYVTNDYIGRKFGIKSTNLDLLLTSNL
jgi:alanine dehydrogenase